MRSRTPPTSPASQNLQYFGAVRGLTQVASSNSLQSAMEASMAHVSELTSFPLVGRARYDFDPARGKLKGAHEIEVAPTLLAIAVGGAGLS